MDKWEREFKIAELVEEAKEYERFERFYESLPVMRNRLRTKESHLPLIYITSADTHREIKGRLVKQPSSKKEENEKEDSSG